MIGKDFLEGRTALVTGAAKRIGRACAVALAQAGADIVIHYNKSQKEAEELASLITASGVNAWTAGADLGNENEIEPFFIKALKMAGRIDILINSASIFSADNLKSADFESIIKNSLVNSWAPFALSRAFAGNCKSGDIINFLDARMNDYDKEHFSYHLSKRDLFAITRMMSIGYAPGIKVNAVAPGLILPPPGEDESYLEKYKKSNPLEKTGTLSDITDAVLFLLKNSFITGQVIYVDGGRHIKGQTYGI